MYTALVVSGVVAHSMMMLVITKERPWAEHLTSLPKREVSAFSRDYGIRYSNDIIATGENIAEMCMPPHCLIMHMSHIHDAIKPQLSRTIVVVKSYCRVVYKLTT